MSETDYLGAADSEYELLSPEEAGAKIEEIRADKEHLYNSLPRTKEREAAVKHVEMLYKAKHGLLHPKELESDAPGLTTEDYLAAKHAEKFSPEHLAAMESALDEKKGRSEAAEAKLQADLRQEIELVNNLFEGSDLKADEILEDPTTAKLEGYKMLRLMGEGNFKALAPLIITDVKNLGMPVAKVEMVKVFMESAVPGDRLSDDLVDVLIKHIYAGKKAKKKGVGNV